MSRLFYLENTASTNDYIQNQIDTSEIIPGSAVYTFHQTNGKGQQGYHWISEPGKNLLYSLVLRPEYIPARNQFLLSKVTALTVQSLLSEYFKKVSIKWPNDLYVNSKKIGGILIENRIRESMIDYAVIGIGININQAIFPEELPNPTSMCLELGEEIDLTGFTEKLHERLLAALMNIDMDKSDDIRKYYLNNLYRRDGFHTYRSKEGEFQAKILNITALGYLVLESEDGTVREYDLKEVVFLEKEAV